MVELMKSIFDDERVLFIGALSFVILNFWLASSNFAIPVFWVAVVLWALIIFLAFRVKRRILKADRLAKAVELGMFTRDVATRFYPFAIVVIISPLVPILLARIQGLESIYFSGFIGALVGLDFDIARG